jgi:hypothetical protein
MLVFIALIRFILCSFTFHKLKEVLFANLEYLRGIPVSDTIFYPLSTTIYILAPYQDPPQTTVVACQVEEITATLCSPFYFPSTNIIGIEKNTHIITDNFEVYRMDSLQMCSNFNQSLLGYSPTAFQGISAINSHNSTIFANALNPCNISVINEYKNPEQFTIYTYSRIYPVVYYISQINEAINFTIYSFIKSEKLFTTALDSFIVDSATIQLSTYENLIFIVSVSGIIIISKQSDTYSILDTLDLRIISINQYNDTIYFAKNLDNVSAYILRITDRVEVIDDIELEEIDIGSSLHLLNESRFLLVGHYGYAIYDITYENDKTVFTMNLYFIFLIALVIVVMSIAVLIVCIKNKRAQKPNAGTTTRRPLGFDQNATALPIRSDETTITEERKIVISMHQIELINKLTSCPLSGGQLEDPVVLTDGYTYERAPIEFWLKTHDVSPVTQQLLLGKSLLNNVSMKNYIEETKKMK